MQAFLVIAVALGMLLSPASSFAKRGRPEPISCPADVDAAIEAECPCAGETIGQDVTQPWRNHGQYVRCVKKYRNQLRKADCLDRAGLRSMSRCAARSTCGKPDRVVCCLSMVDTCSDPVPGDQLMEGICGDDADRPCDSEVDCTRTRARMKRTEEACLEAGGTVAGEGSLCTACELPEP